MRLLREALRDLRSNKLRNVLTGLSLMLGVFAIVAIYTIGSITREVFVANEEQKNGRAITAQITMPFGTMSPKRLVLIRRALKRRVLIQGGSYALSLGVQAEVDTSPQEVDDPEAMEVGLELSGGDLSRVRRLPASTGRWLSGGNSIFPAEVVMNSPAATLFEAHVGQIVRLKPGRMVAGYPARVVGVIADGNDEPFMYSSLASALTYRPDILARQNLGLLIHHRSASLDQIRGMARRVASDINTDPSEVEAFRKDGVGQLVAGLRATQRNFGFAAVGALSIAVIGMINIGLASVRERSRELVIRRAVGATRLRVFSLVLLSSVAVGLLAGLSAVGISIAGVYWLVPELIDPAKAIQNPSFPWAAGLAGLVGAFATSVLAGVVPAIRATQVDVALVLRD